ncbi:MAG: metal ABC transporter permease [Chloroflexi bacterium]|nr:metal ABC transporter permease [Chloroflexota bacterium]
MDSLWGSIMEPIGFAFMQRGLLAVVIVGITCGVVGAYVVLRGMAFLGDALAHAVFPGIVAAYLLNLHVAIGALLAGLATVLGIGLIARHTRLHEDAAIGILFAGAFSLGIVLLSGLRSYTRDLASLLLGNVLGVAPEDLLLTGLLAMLVIAATVALYRALLITSFDSAYGIASGLPVFWLDTALLVLIALTVIISLQTVGNILVVALLVTPSATARLWTKHLTPMMALGAALGALAGVVGLFASYYLNAPSGATIVLVSTLLFLVSLLVAPGGLRERVSRGG